MKPASSEFVNKMPPWAVGVVVVSVIAAIGGITYVGYGIIKKKQEEADSSDVVKDVDKEYQNLPKNEKELSAPFSAYSSTINLIVKLLDGAEKFESEIQVIESIIKVVKKPADWLFLVKQFGTKNIADIGWGTTNYDLITLLKDQLDSSGVYSINVNGYKQTGFAFNSVNILSEYLKKIGINF